MNDHSIARFTDEDGDDNALPAEFATATMGHVLLAQGRVDEARAVFTAALERDPSDASAREGLDALGAPDAGDDALEVIAPQAFVRAIGMSPTELMVHWSAPEGSTAHLGAGSRDAPLALLVTTLRAGSGGVMSEHRSVLLDAPEGELALRELSPAATHLVALGVRIGARVIPFAQSRPARTPTDAPQPYERPARRGSVDRSEPPGEPGGSTPSEGDGAEADAGEAQRSFESAYAQWLAGVASS